MSDRPSKRIWKRVLLALVWVFVVLLFSFLSSCTLLIETPIHFLLGWLFHAGRVLPPQLADWRALLLPLGCLILAGWLLHRFVRWSIATKGGLRSWSPGQTISALALLLLGCAAAIAMSGIVHQAVWLFGAPQVVNRGRNIELTLAVNNARNLLFMLQDHHDTNGRYPDSLADLKFDNDIADRILRVAPGSGGLREPFILLHPGRSRIASADEPLIMSPVITSHGDKVAVGYGDGSVRATHVRQIVEILRNLDAETPRIPPRNE